MTARSILLGAAALVRGGFCKGRPYQEDETGAFVARCGVAALDDALHGHSDSEKPVWAAVVGELPPWAARSLVAYSDHPNTTAEDVAQLFELAAARCGS